MEFTVSFAYHILAHKNPAQVERLLQVLHDPEDTFVLHFDRRAPRELHQLGQQWAISHSNVHVQRSRRVVWGGPQISEIQIEAMDLALRASSTWSHFFNLTGQDFPLGSRTRRLAALAPHADHTFISWFSPLETPLWSNARERIERWYLHSPSLQVFLTLPGIGRRLRRALGWGGLPYIHGLHRAPPPGFTYRGGSNYGVFARVACEYLARDPTAQSLVRWLHHSAHADEITFQSILSGSPLAPTLINKNWREIDFPLHAPHPRIFTLSDLERLTGSPNLFARKFDAAVDAAILERLALAAT